MLTDLSLTLLELGDATSQNLEFAHRKSVHVSYGEETITEQNLLEIRRRHKWRTCIKTFSRQQEGRNGADWEWHLIGRAHTLKMRVQAKRVRSDNRLRIKHKVKSTGSQQRSLLITAAKQADMKPLYCIYCTNDQRCIWDNPVSIKGIGSFETGCLLADADHIPETTTRLCQVERHCIPWHYLCTLRYLSRGVSAENDLEYYKILQPDICLDPSDDSTICIDRWNPPSIEYLNNLYEGSEGNQRVLEGFDTTGVDVTKKDDLVPLSSGTGYNARKIERETERLLEQEIHRWVVTDVRQERPIRFDDQHFLER